MGIVKFQLSLLKSAKTVLVELPGIVTKSRSWSDGFWSHFDYECLFLDGNFSINIVQEADDENEVGASISSITIDLVPTKSKSYRDRELFDINPIHKIREILTDYTAMNKPESDINDENFKFAARRIWDEGLGVSGAFTEKSCKDAIDELLYHIEAGIRVNRQTGLYEVILFRDDLLDLDNAQVFNESNIKSFNIEVANIDDMINSVNVNYYDRDNIKDSSFSLDEIGSILSSQSNAETIDFLYFMNRRNAELVGNWKLKQLSTPTRKGSFTTGKYDARKINRYDVIKLSWLNQGFADLPVRIMKIGLGDGIDNTVTLDWVEVIPFSDIAFQTINVDPPTSVILPPQIAAFIAFEAPYFEAVQNMGQTQVDAELANNPDAGFIGFDADESHRAKDYDDAKFKVEYPLIEWGWGRDECIDEIRKENLPLPSKSSCFFCPNMRPHEIMELNALYPHLAERALKIESNAELTTIKGLGRRFAWSDLLRQTSMFNDMYESSMPCGCYDGD